MSQTATAPAAYRMALPDCWTRLPMEPVAMRAAARAYLLKKYGNISRDETFQVRRQLEQDLVDLTRRPGAEYARSLLALSLDVQGRPISASCLVSVVDVDLTGDGALEGLVADEADGAVDAAVVDLGANRGAVVIRHDVTRTPRPEDPEGIAAQARQVAVQMGALDDANDPRAVEESLKFELDTRVVDVWLPVPEEPRTLLLQFSTPIAPLFDVMTELFLLTACTVQFRDADGRWR